MDLLLIIGLVVWIANAVKKRKEAEKQRSAKKRANTAFEGMFDSAEGMPDPLFDAKTTDPVQTFAPTAQKPPARRISPRLSTPQQRRHTLEPSTRDGHAHTESSMSGFSDDCPPVKAPFETAPLSDRLAAYKAQKREAARHTVTETADTAPQVIDLAAASGNASFRFDPNRVREGLIYAEILGKPKALRR